MAQIHSLNIISITTKTKQMSYLWKFSCKQEQESNTYHSLLPDDAHAILNARKPVGDLCEIILAHGFLVDGKWAVVRCHHVQSVTVAGQRRSHLVTFIAVSVTETRNTEISWH